MKRESLTPTVIASALLLLPLLYVGSYLVLVQPRGRIVLLAGNFRTGAAYRVDHYRAFNHRAAQVFWPLEQIDRKLRPGAWRTFPMAETMPYL